LSNDSEYKQIHTRVYGTAGPWVILLHGGPGAAGYMAPIAHKLADSFRVLEPFQRGSGSEPLTVARHVADLHEVIKTHCGDERPALVGHSWGAMLALAYTVWHSDSVQSLVLIACGTFDSASRSRLEEIRSQRMGEDMAHCMERLTAEYPDPDRRLDALGRLMQQIDSCKLISLGNKPHKCDAQASKETWQDIMRLQNEGKYPAAFAEIHVPVIMLHGAFDPHPGRMIEAGLKQYMPQLEYVEWEKCGHYPWLEKAARDEFYATLRQWLLR
jgi:pimeloyl-ACP methyl ester carboxylesterase